MGSLGLCKERDESCLIAGDDLTVGWQGVEPGGRGSEQREDAALLTTGREESNKSFIGESVGNGGSGSHADKSLMSDSTLGSMVPNQQRKKDNEYESFCSTFSCNNLHYP